VKLFEAFYKNETDFLLKFQRILLEKNTTHIMKGCRESGQTNYAARMDYGEITFRNGKYDEKELEKALMINKRAELILKHYQKYNSKRTLGFCSTRKYAEYMAEYFCKKWCESLCCCE
jgi:superfamily II DNA or RNA helicase